MGKFYYLIVGIVTLAVASSFCILVIIMNFLLFSKKTCPIQMLYVLREPLIVSFFYFSQVQFYLLTYHVHVVFVGLIVCR